MATPDDLLRAYFENRDHAGPPGMSLLAIEAMVPSAYCAKAKCRSALSRESTKQRDDYGTPRLVCLRCGSDWPMEHRFILRGQLDIPPRPGASDLRLVRFAELGNALHRFRSSRRWRWASTCYIPSALGLASYRDLADEGARRFPRAPFEWSKDSVARLVREGREAWGAACERAGLLGEGANGRT